LHIQKSIYNLKPEQSSCLLHLEPDPTAQIDKRPIANVKNRLLATPFTAREAAPLCSSCIAEGEGTSAEGVEVGVEEAARIARVELAVLQKEEKSIDRSRYSDD